jgi:DNA (cytosine-5)-methyltransferase 1
MSAEDNYIVVFDETQITSDKNYSNPQPGAPSHPLASGARPPTIAATLTANYGKQLDNSDRNGGPPNIVCGPLNAHSARHGHAMTTQQAVEAGQMIVAYNWQSGGDVRLSFGKPNLHCGQVPAVWVRRLTPTECERLQGFLDGWTDGQSDSARYRMLGNAVCVNVAEWIGRRIVRLCS